MRSAEELVRCKTQGEVLKVVEPEGRALLMEWKQKLFEEALEHPAGEYRHLCQVGTARLQVRILLGEPIL